MRDILPEVFEEYAGRLRRHLLLVARTRRRVIGLLFLQWYEEACYFDPAVTRYAEIHEVHVHPDFRNRGVATGLVERALREAARRGCEAVYLVTDKLQRPRPPRLREVRLHGAQHGDSLQEEPHIVRTSASTAVIHARPWSDFTSRT